MNEVELTSEILNGAVVKIVLTIIFVLFIAWAINEPREHWRVEKRKRDDPK
jgi:hypothetical protein